MLHCQPIGYGNVNDDSDNNNYKKNPLLYFSFRTILFCFAAPSEGWLSFKVKWKLSGNNFNYVGQCSRNGKQPHCSIIKAKTISTAKQMLLLLVHSQSFGWRGGLCLLCKEDELLFQPANHPSVRTNGKLFSGEKTIENAGYF